MSFLEAVTLENAFVRLEPLNIDHGNDLAEAVRDAELWRTWYTNVPSPESMDEAIQTRLSAAERGETVPWAIVEPASGRAIGMTSYLHIEQANRRLEIGSTWMARAAQGTAINPAAKLLLLTRAFKTLGCIAVEFRTHWHNRQSRAAIEKLGAKQDGVLRNHVIFANGTVRDTVVYSIIENEWPTVRFGLHERLERMRAARDAGPNDADWTYVPLSALKGSAADSGPHTDLGTMTVDGETFAVRRRDADGAVHYDWVSGRNEGYGFSVFGGPGPLGRERHEASIREFLSSVDPETGYLSSP